MSRRHLAGLLSLALFGSACSGIDLDDLADEANDVDSSLPSPATSGDPDDRAEPPADPGAAAEIIDDDCFDDEARCGTVLVPQVPGSRDLVEIGFRVITDSGSGIPIVLLESGGFFELTADDFPERPLIAIGARGQWPGGPDISCPELSHLDPDADGPAIAAAAEQCVKRLTDTGIDLAGGSRTNQAADVIAVLDALGVAEFDVISSDIRADLVAAIAASPLTVREAIYVQPVFTGWDPISGTVQQALLGLEAVWARCEETTPCTTAGTVDDFLRAVESLDDRPITHVTTDASGDPILIDAAELTRAVFRELRTPSGAGFIPELHRLVLERDAASLSAFVDLAFGNRSLATLTIACERLQSTPADFDDLPPRLKQWSLDTHVRYSATCPEWGSPVPEIPVAPPTGLFLTTLSTIDPDNTMATAGTVIVEPTVGRSSAACISGAARAWFDEGRVDSGSCETPLTIGRRDSEFEFIEGHYTVDDVTLTLQVPDNWTDYGSGIWYREADPLDPALLDLYVRDNEDAAVALTQMVTDWNVLEPVYTTEQTGGRKWALATGGDGWSGGRTLITIAMTRIEGVTVAVVMEAEESDLEDLTRSVLIPALEGLTVDF